MAGTAMATTLVLKARQVLSGSIDRMHTPRLGRGFVRFGGTGRSSEVE